VRRVNGKTYEYRRAQIWMENDKGVRVRKSIYAKNDRELEKKIKAAKSRPVGDISPDKVSLGDYVERWLDTHPRLKPKTSADYRSNLQNHIKPRIGKAKLSKLRPEHFRALFKELADDLVGAPTAQVSYRLLHASLNRLVKDGTLPRNPLANVDKPRAPKADIQIPTEAQVRAILKAAKGTRDYPLVLLAVVSGLRLGELLGLRWRDVNLDEGYIVVRHTLTKDLQLEEPKTPGSHRRVDLDETTLKALKAHRKLSPGDHVFTAPKGGYVSQTNFHRRAWAPLLEKAKVPHLRFHSLRHFGNSLLAKQGVNLKVLQARLGQTTTRMTLDTYAHLMPGETRQAAEIIGEAMRKKGK
jgi:integrase